MKVETGLAGGTLGSRLDPLKIWVYLRRGRKGLSTLARERLLATLFGVRCKDVRDVVAEVLDSGLRDDIASKKGKISRGQMFYTHGECLYAVCRLLRPAVVVETGVGAGVSSAYILAALDRNDRGVLHSIDLPAREPIVDIHGSEIEILPERAEVGWLVPSNLRARWDLRLGKNTDLLRPLLDEVGPVGMFLHDSEHTEENMRWEFETAWPAVEPGGFLISDDVWWNRAFLGFAGRIDAPGGVLDRRLGMLRKPRGSRSSEFQRDVV